VGHDFWNSARIDLLRELVANDRHHSASEIADQLSRESYLTVTRNMIIGKIQRMGLEQAWMRNSKRGRSPETAVKRVRPKLKAPRKVNGYGFNGHVKPIPPTFICEALTTEGRVQFQDLLEWHCRWPIGNPQDGHGFGFCGAAKIEGQAYCERHCQAAYHGWRLA
jgi:hypothetical protein